MRFSHLSIFKLYPPFYYFLNNFASHKRCLYLFHIRKLVSNIDFGIVLNFNAGLIVVPIHHLMASRMILLYFKLTIIY